MWGRGELTPWVTTTQVHYVQDMTAGTTCVLRACVACHMHQILRWICVCVLCVDRWDAEQLRYNVLLLECLPTPFYAVSLCSLKGGSIRRQGHDGC
jgi:hypothetical protein